MTASIPLTNGKGIQGARSEGMDRRLTIERQQVAFVYGSGNWRAADWSPKYTIVPNIILNCCHSMSMDAGPLAELMLDLMPNGQPKNVIMT